MIVKCTSCGADTEVRQPEKLTGFDPLEGKCPQCGKFNFVFKNGDGPGFFVIGSAPKEPAHD